MLRITKEKQYLIFDDGTNIIKFDMSFQDENDFYFKNSKLFNMTIEEAKEYFEDEYIYLMFRDIAKKEHENKIKNILSALYDYKNFEQIYSAGLKVFMTPSVYGYDGDFSYTINDIPKGLRKICKENNMYLTNRVVDAYLSNPDIYNTIFFNKNNYKGLKKTNLKEIAEYKMRGHGLMLQYLHDFLHYSIKDLMFYFDYLKVDLKIKNNKEMLNLYSDYVKRHLEEGDEFEKYPKDFWKEYEKIKLKNEEFQKLNRSIKAKQRALIRKKKDQENISIFNKCIKPEYEIEYDEYKFIYPKSIAEIREEGKRQHNCVATYIGSVLRHECDILFLRKKDDLNKNYITIEVRNGNIVQAKRLCNERISLEDRLPIDYFNKKFGNGEYLEDDDDFENLEDF